jgi:hypothetical protein
MKKISIAVISALLLISCSKKNTPKPPPAPKPLAATLSLPANNAACAGTPVAGINSDNQSFVTFSWAAGSHSDSYNLIITDLSNDSTFLAENTNATSTTWALKQGTPYSWYLVSLSNSTPDTTHSATWKFYVAGQAQTDFAPFPATLVSPIYGAAVSAGTVTLSWNGSAVGNNITGYDVYMGTTSSPSVYQSGITTTHLNITIASGKTYYWQVVTHDSNNNSSTSQVGKFSAQ